MDFSYSEGTGLWITEATFRDGPVRIQIDGSCEEDRLGDLAEKALAKVSDNWIRIQENIRDSLHETYNESWADPEEGLPTLSVGEFLERITLRTIWLKEENTITLLFNDGGLFEGHSVDLFWHSDGKMYPAEVAG